MTKSELIDAIASRTDVSKADVGSVLDGFFDVAAGVVSRSDEKITIPGFLAIQQTQRKARMGRNPATGEPLAIPAGTGVKISAGSKLKKIASGKAPAP
jgi:DNA-binding protein HU-beta